MTIFPYWPHYVPALLPWLHWNPFPAPFLTFNVDGAKDTIARGINKAGVVVGTWTDMQDINRGFRRNASGTIDTFDFVPAAALNWTVYNTVAAGINNDGDIVGFFRVLTEIDPKTKLPDRKSKLNPSYGFRLKAFPEGTKPVQKDFLLVDLNTDPTVAADAAARVPPAVVGTHPQCINDAKHIGGRYFFIPPGFPAPGVPDNDVHGFLLTGGNADRVGDGVKPIDVYANKRLTEIYGINSTDNVVGVTDEGAAKPHGYAFLGRGANSMTPLFESIDFPGATFSRAMGIASKISSGLRVVGEFTTVIGGTVTSRAEGYVWDLDSGSEPERIDVVTAPTPYDLWFGSPTLAWSTQAHGINDDGSLIVGEFREQESGAIRGFILNYYFWKLWQVWRFRPFTEPPTPVPSWEWWPGVAVPKSVREPAKPSNSRQPKRQGERRKSPARKSRKG